MRFKIIIFLLLLACALFLPSAYAESGYWDTSFSNRLQITITTDGTSMPTGYQKLLNISYESEMQADFDDIRFTDSSNNELSYFLVSKVDSNYAIVRVELSDAITHPGSDTIWIYFGNAGVSSGSVGADTFLSYFDGDSTGWTEVDPNSHIAFTNNRLDFAGLTRGEDAYVYQSNANVNGDILVEYSIYITSFVSSGYAGFGIIGDVLDDWNNMDNGIQTSRAASAPDMLNAKRIADSQTVGDNTVSISLGTQYWIRSTIDRSGNMVSIVYSDSDRTSQVGSSMTVDASDVSATLDYIYLLNSLDTGDSERSSTGWIDDFSVRKYIANEPTASYGDSQYYTDSLHYNAASPYNHRIDLYATLTANRSITASDDTNDTAKSTGDSYLIINAFDNEASIVRNFTFTGDSLDWYQAANLSGSYDLKNTGGIIETKSNGNFTTNLAPGTYWIEESGFLISSMYSIPYSSEAYIIWTTDVPSSNIVEYSLYADLSSSSFSTWENTTTSPQILLEELTRDTTYYYKVSSTFSGDTTTSTTMSFNTKNNTHGFSYYFDKAFVVNDIDGWSVGESMFEAYADVVGAYIVWTLILGSVFLVMTIRMESVVVPVVLSLISAAFLFPLLPPEHDIATKVILGLAITGILWHLFIGRR